MHGSVDYRRFDSTLLSRIEDAGLNASASAQQLWIDGWLVRFSPGKAKRARCVNAVAIGRQTVEERLAACKRVFDGARLPLIVRITPFTLPPGLDGLLEQRGMQRFDDTRVMVLGSLADIAEPFAPDSVSVQGIGLEAFAQRIGGLRGSALSQRQAHAERLLNSPVPFFAFELRADGELAACAQMAIEGDIVGLYDVYTVEASRRRGYAQELCCHLLREARARGARHAYLQVEADNGPARSAYVRLGFADAYAYHYRTDDPAEA
jgi:ribosomal protein S18 acetylase RimI-like enzyme